MANVAHVGASTVSRFLRGVSIKPDAAERVAAAIKQLGYTPDEAARVLRGGSTKTIGVIVPQVDNTFFSKAIQAIQLELHNRGFALLLLLHEEDLERQAHHLATLKRYRVDGVVLASAPGSTVDLVRASLADTPVVAFDRVLSTEMDWVTLRNQEAARAATEHLLRHGYKSITCVTASRDLYTVQERIAGYVDAMNAANKASHVLEAHDYGELRMMLTSLLSSRGSESLLSLSNMATGSILFAHNDLGLSDNLRLPVIGFDDFDFAPLMNPSLSVIRQPIDLMVRYALDLLFRRMEEKNTKAIPSAPQLINLAGELICRHSCGCA